jgi:hypothetical protein
MVLAVETQRSNWKWLSSAAAIVDYYFSSIALPAILLEFQIREPQHSKSHSGISSGSIVSRPRNIAQKGSHPPRGRKAKPWQSRQKTPTKRGAKACTERYSWSSQTKRCRPKISGHRVGGVRAGARSRQRSGSGRSQPGTPSMRRSGLGKKLRGQCGWQSFRSKQRPRS